MKFLAACFLAVLSMTTLVLADGAPPPRLPTAEGDKKPVSCAGNEIVRPAGKVRAALWQYRLHLYA